MYMTQVKHLSGSELAVLSYKNEVGGHFKFHRHGLATCNDEKRFCGPVHLWFKLGSRQTRVHLWRIPRKNGQIAASCVISCAQNTLPHVVGVVSSRAVTTPVRLPTWTQWRTMFNSVRDSLLSSSSPLHEWTSGDLISTPPCSAHNGKKKKIICVARLSTIDGWNVVAIRRKWLPKFIFAQWNWLSSTPGKFENRFFNTSWIAQHKNWVGVFVIRGRKKYLGTSAWNWTRIWPFWFEAHPICLLC